MAATRPLGPGCVVARLCHYPAVREIVLGIHEAERRPSDLRHQHQLARTTLYSHVARLFELGIVVRHETPGPPWRVYYEQGPNGVEFVDLLHAWADVLSGLAGASWDAPLHFAEAWAAGVVPALLDGPLTVAQVVADCAGRASGSQVERLLRQLRGHGFFLRAGHRYAAADAARVAIGDLAASARFERRHMEGDGAPITVTDAVDGLRGTLPLLALPCDSAGLCEFVVRAGESDPGPRAAACWAEIDSGHVVACGAGKAPGPPTTWAQGTLDDWLAAVIDRRPAVLRSAGGRDLSDRVVRDLNSQLYGSPMRHPSTGGDEFPAFSGHLRIRDS